MEDKDKSTILLKEYDTLRAEVLKRLDHRFAFVSLFGAVGAYAFFVAKDLSQYQIVVLLSSGAGLMGVWWQLGNLIARCANRVAEIEKEINVMAGEHLLRWESERLGSKVFRQMQG